MEVLVQSIEATARTNEEKTMKLYNAFARVGTLHVLKGNSHNFLWFMHGKKF